MNEILLIDKKAGWTSFDVVAKVRSALRAKHASNQPPTTNDPRQRLRVGHAGTLDPFATGLLIVLVGSATKDQDSYMKQDKEYEATLRLGYTSTTGDPEGEITPYESLQRQNGRSSLDCHAPLAMTDIEKTLKQFTGEIEQTPPIYSAIKIDGQRAYTLARAGKEVKMKPRTVTIYSLSIISYSFPELRVRVQCSSGTYIRTLGEDIGKALGCGAYLTALRRTKIGNFNVEDAHNVEDTIKALL